MLTKMAFEHNILVHKSNLYKVVYKNN